ncbi:MAG: acyl-CoA dehydrogenase family protein [Dehalococcoidia bacterium]
MNSELQATTDAGRRFVALAEEHAADFATRADQHDREASFPHENIKALQESGFLAGPVPEEFGGLGVQTLHDISVGMSRLSRGCASTAIAANMHIAAAWEMSRIWRWRAQAAPGMPEAVEGLMRGIAAKQIIACGANTEAGTDLSSPMTEATPTEDGYVINGRKMFGTLSPAATLIFSFVRVPEGGGYRGGLAFYPKNAPGVTVLDNWDAMGMRASGSHDILLEDLRVPRAGLVPGRTWGVLDAGAADTYVSLNFSLACCFLGIGEAARDLAIERATRKKGPSGKALAERIPIQQLIAEIEIDLATSRAIVDRVAHMADAHFSAYAPGQTPSAEAYAMLKENQIMKWVVQRKAIDIVDKAMTATGGSAYLAGSPFSRLYRDVRAGPFMQPFAPYEALEYIGKVTLGLDPQLDR